MSVALSSRGGRLNYIDGCTDTLLVPPVKMGDACLNVLYFPSNTHQTRHYHPSIRTGVIISGEGECHTSDGVLPLVPGSIFFCQAKLGIRFIRIQVVTRLNLHLLSLLFIRTAILERRTKSIP